MCTTRMERTLCSFGSTRIKIAPRVQLPQTVDMNTALDAVDLEILDILQHDARLPQSALGARVGLSTAAVNRRMRRLTDSGVITGSAVTVAPEKLGRPVTVIVHIAVESEQLDILDGVRSSFVNCRQVQQCYYVAGEWDFVLILMVRDMQEYTELTRQLFFANDNVRRFSTHVVMDRAKTTLTVPTR